MPHQLVRRQLLRVIRPSPTASSRPRVRKLLHLHPITPRPSPNLAARLRRRRPPFSPSDLPPVAGVRRAHPADEEVSDPKALLEERSKAKCVSQWYEYQKCVKRIQNDETGHKHCTGQYFDYWQCVDKNVAEKLFDLLK
ncbi:hypothetical protein ACP70R_026878 [Stipagrostis hirtigluma subsp. patula]